MSKESNDPKKPQLGAVVEPDFLRRFSKMAHREHRTNADELRYIVERYMNEFEKNNPE